LRLVYFILIILHHFCTYSQTFQSCYRITVNNPLLAFAGVSAKCTKITETDGKIAHVKFYAQDIENSNASIKVIEAELIIDSKTNLVYSLADSTFFIYKNPDIISDFKNAISPNEYVSSIIHGSDTTKIIFDKRLPSFCTGELLLQKHQHGVKKLIALGYETDLVYFKKIKGVDLAKELEKAKIICKTKREPKNLLFGY